MIWKCTERTDVSKYHLLEKEIERNGELVDDEENGLGDGVGRRDHIVRVHISTSDPVRK